MSVINYNDVLNQVKKCIFKPSQFADENFNYMLLTCDISYKQRAKKVFDYYESSKRLKINPDYIDWVETNIIPCSEVQDVLCPKCGSDNVQGHMTVTWDKVIQEFISDGSLHDLGQYCLSCDSEVNGFVNKFEPSGTNLGETLC